jgi:hypothetical protein
VEVISKYAVEDILQVNDMSYNSIHNSHNPIICALISHYIFSSMQEA